MKVYADTSVLVAWFHPGDHFAEDVSNWCRSRVPEFCWNPILRVELRHALRRLRGSYAPVAWHAYRGSETNGRLRLGRETLVESLEWADELSSQHAQSTAAGVWDYLHIALALRTRADIFVTCDEAQSRLASGSGLEWHLFKDSSA